MPEQPLCSPSGDSKAKGRLLFPLVISGKKWTRLLLSRAIFSQINPASISPVWWHFEGQWSNKISLALYDSHTASGETLTEPVSRTPALSYSWNMCWLLLSNSEIYSCMFKKKKNNPKLPQNNLNKIRCINPILFGFFHSLRVLLQWPNPSEWFL